MKCTDFELRLQRLFDERGTLDGDAELRAHALTCAECQELVETYEMLFDGFAASVARRKPAESQRVEVAPRAQVVPSHRNGARWVAAAAVIGLATFAAQSLQQPAGELPRANQLVARPAAPPVSPAVVVTPVRQETIEPAKTNGAIVDVQAVKVEPLASSPMETPVPDDAVASTPYVSAESDMLGLSFLESPADEYAGLYRATGRGVAVMLRSIPPLHLESAVGESNAEEHDFRAWRAQLHSSIEPLTASMAEAWQEFLRGKPAPSSPTSTDRAS